MPTKRWREVLHPKILQILTLERATKVEDEVGSAGKRRTQRKVILSSLDVESNLEELLAFEDPVIRAIGLVICGYIRPAVARKAAEQMLTDESLSKHPLLLSTVEHMANMAIAENQAAPLGTLRANVQLVAQPEDVIALEKSFITIGRAADNDITISDSAVWSYHLAIRASQSEVRLIRLGDGAVFVDGRQVREESVVLEKGSVISLDSLSQAAPKITIDWENPDTSVLPIHPVLRLAMLAQNDKLGHLPLGTLADIAARSRAERHIRGAKLETVLDEEQYFLVHQGQICLFDPLEMDFVPDTVFGPGDVIGSDMIDHGSPVFPEVVSGFAIVLHVPPGMEVKMAALRHQIKKQPAQSGAAMIDRRLFVAGA
jgi:hypothetical protein